MAAITSPCPDNGPQLVNRQGQLAIPEHNSMLEDVQYFLATSIALSEDGPIDPLQRILQCQ